MESNPKSNSRSALRSASHLKSYDPSEQYRQVLVPRPPSVTTAVPPNNQNSSNPVLSENDISIMNDPKNGVVQRIPQFYYPLHNEDNNPPTTNPNVVQPTQTNPYVPPPPPPVMPQQIPFPLDPYASGQYYPYATPYIIPLTGYPQPDPALLAQEQSKSEVIAAHQKDADLSRLEVYHFTPKQNTSLSMGGLPVQPIVQYHVFPNSPGMPPPPRPQQPYPAYPQPWYGQPPYGSYEQMLPPVETKARGAQTDEISTKSRGISPFYFPEAAPVYDEDGYPYVHHRTMHTDRYNLPTGRINQRFYDYTDSSAINDCRCLDCQRERSKVLNYYPD